MHCLFANSRLPSANIPLRLSLDRRPILRNREWQSPIFVFILYLSGIHAEFTVLDVKLWKLTNRRERRVIVHHIAIQAVRKTLWVKKTAETYFSDRRFYILGSSTFFPSLRLLLPFCWNFFGQMLWVEKCHRQLFTILPCENAIIS